MYFDFIDQSRLSLSEQVYLISKVWECPSDLLVYKVDPAVHYFPSVVILESNPGIKSRSPVLQVDSVPAEPRGKPKNSGVGSLSLLQQIFPTQELNQGLLHYRQILYQLSYQGSPINSLDLIKISLLMAMPDNHIFVWKSQLEVCISGLCWWLLPVQETWVRSLIPEDPTCPRATTAPQLCSRAGKLRLLSPRDKTDETQEP